MTPRIIVANLGVRLKSFYRERSAMFFTFAFPVILVLVFGTIFTKPEHLNFDLPVQDNSRSEASGRLLEVLATGDAFTVVPVPAAVDATQFAKEHKLNLLLVIPKDFETLHKQRVVDPHGGVPVPLTYVYDPSSTAVETKIQLLNAIGALTWDWWWWNRSTPWLIFVFGYLTFFVVAFWVHDMPTVRQKARVVATIFAFDLACLVVFGGILKWI